MRDGPDCTRCVELGMKRGWERSFTPLKFPTKLTFIAPSLVQRNASPGFLQLSREVKYKEGFRRWVECVAEWVAVTRMLLLAISSVTHLQINQTSLFRDKCHIFQGSVLDAIHSLGSSGHARWKHCLFLFYLQAGMVKCTSVWTTYWLWGSRSCGFNDCMFGL